mgnify:CR=1 FL=1
MFLFEKYSDGLFVPAYTSERRNFGKYASVFVRNQTGENGKSSPLEEIKESSNEHAERELMYSCVI